MRSPQQILMLLSARHVKRFHTSQFIGEQTVADHSWGVAAIAAYLTEFSAEWANPARRLGVVLAALHHDASEKWLGDVPASVRDDAPLAWGAADVAEERVLRALGYPTSPLSLPDEDRRVVFIADKLDLMQTVSDQAALGNTRLGGIFVHARAAALRETHKLAPGGGAARRAAELVSALDDAYAAALTRSGKHDVELLAKLHPAPPPTDVPRES